MKEQNMKPFRRTLVISVMGTAAIMAPLAAQSGPDPLFLERFERLNKALEKIPLDMRMDLDLDLDGVTMALSHPLFGLAFQQPDRERELERACQTDEELKLYAINALVDSDPERAIPLLEKLLNDSKNPPRLKERALFVLARSRSDKAQEIVGRYAKGGSNPDLQLRAVEYLGQFR